MHTQEALLNFRLNPFVLYLTLPARAPPQKNSLTIPDSLQRSTSSETRKAMYNTGGATMMQGGKKTVFTPNSPKTEQNAGHLTLVCLVSEIIVLYC